MQLHRRNSWGFNGFMNWGYDNRRIISQNVFGLQHDDGSDRPHGKNKLVERVKDPADRRVVRIHLLAEGERIIQEVILKRQAYLRDMFATFSEEETAAFEKSLLKLQHEMKRK